MEAQYVYTKTRADFGRYCHFVEEGPRMIVDNRPDKQQMEKYMLRNPVHRGTVCADVMAEHDVNTESVEYDEHGMNHLEGSWPKDINPNDPEQTIRFRRKVEKDEVYIQKIKTLSKPMEHFIFQNNTVNIYEEYYTDVDFHPLNEPSFARKEVVYKNPSKFEKPVNDIAWSPSGNLLAVSYCSMQLDRSRENEDITSYVWDVGNPNWPVRVLEGKESITCMDFNPKEPHTIVSGLYSGEVAVWDIRDSAALTAVSILQFSHREPVCSIIVGHSKTGTEFFSTAPDGQVMWWDVRMLNTPTEVLVLDPEKGEQNISRAVGASCLEYESTIPTKFMVGTQMGEVIICNRKVKTPAEMILAKYSAHVGPVCGLQRNQAVTKNFLSVGDWSAKIWVEEVKSSPIIWTKYHKVKLTGGCWSPTRYSCFFTTKEDGTLDIWDLLRSLDDPYMTVKITDDKLSCLKVHEQGLQIAVGDSIGTVYLVTVSESLAESDKSEKVILGTLLERECRREKLIEARDREMKLKLKLRAKAESIVETSDADEIARMNKAEEDFFANVTKHLQPRVPEEEEEGEGKEEAEESEATESKHEEQVETEEQSEPAEAPTESETQE